MKQMSDAELLNEEYDAVLRGLASYVGAGGFNDLDKLIDPQVADAKIRWGIDHLIEVERKRAIKTRDISSE